MSVGLRNLKYNKTFEANEHERRYAVLLGKLFSFICLIKVRNERTFMFWRNSVCSVTRHLSIMITFGVIIMPFLFSACGSGNKEIGEAIAERDSLPMMTTLGVTTFISDSGITRYKVVTEEWLVYDRKNPSYWAFEKGVYLEQFDSLFNIEASVKADTAYYYDKTKLWRLSGHVDVKNRKGERFNTELLYWNQATKKIYTDRFIRIQQPDRIIHAHGFDSDEQLTQYQCRNIDGIFYVDEEEKPTAESDESFASADSLKTDSIGKK